MPDRIKDFSMKILVPGIPEDAFFRAGYSFYDSCKIVNPDTIITTWSPLNKIPNEQILLSNNDDPQDIHILFGPPGEANKNRGTSATFCWLCWDTTDIPVSWVEQCNQLDGIIVPNGFVKDVLVSHGVTVPVEIIPPIVRVLKSNKLAQEGITVFTAVGSFNPRKNWTTIANAFQKAFPKELDVAMLFKTRFCPFNIPNFVSRDPRIQFIIWDFTEEEMSDLYNNTTCIVNPSHSEGFGMVPREAGLLGVPCIVPLWGGLKDMAENPGAILIEVNETCIANNTAFLPTANDNIGSWAKIEERQIVAAMRYVYENKEDMKMRGEAGKEWLEKNNLSDCQVVAKFLSTLVYKRPVWVTTHEKVAAS